MSLQEELLWENLLRNSRALLKVIASNTYHCSSERATPRRSGGKHNIDAVMLLASRVEALARDKIGTSSTPASSAIPAGTYTVYETCGV